MAFIGGIIINAKLFVTNIISSAMGSQWLDSESWVDSEEWID